MKNPTIFSAEIPSGSFKKIRTIGAIFVCLIPILVGIYIGFDFYPMFKGSLLAALLMVSAWFCSEIAIIWYLYKSQSTPKYVYECFQLNLVFSNMWFVWILLVNYSNNA